MTNAYSIDTSVSKQAQKQGRIRSFGDFLVRARAKFGGRFDYLESTYQNTQIKMEIACPKHGSFWQAPCDHLRDKTKHACLKCSKESFRSNYSDFKIKALDVHGGAYEYPPATLRKLHDFVPIVCPIHGLFKQRAYSHLAGFGCKGCADDDMRKDIQDFIRESQAVHGVGRYDYSKVIYKRSDVNVEIICPEHGLFLQTPASHVAQSAGCPDCSVRSKGFGRSDFQHYCNINNNGNGFLYVIKCKSGSEVFYKIGITSKGVDKRFYPSKMPYDYEVMFLITHNADFIYNLEARLHSMLKTDKHMPIMSFAGETECFLGIKKVTPLLKMISNTNQYQLIT